MMRFNHTNNLFVYKSTAPRFWNKVQQDRKQPALFTEPTMLLQRSLRPEELVFAFTCWEDDRFLFFFCTASAGCGVTS